MKLRFGISVKSNRGLYRLLSRKIPNQKGSPELILTVINRHVNEREYGASANPCDLTLARTGEMHRDVGTPRGPVKV